MAVVDFTTGVEDDPTSKITVSSTKVDWAALSTATAARVYKDYTASHFNGNFEHLWEGYLDNTTTDGAGGLAWAVTNSTSTLATSTDNHLRLRFQDEGNARFNLQEVYASTTYQDFDGLTRDTLYYCKTKRDEAVGTYGTLYNYVYSDSGRTTLVATQTLTLHGFVDFQYLYAMAGQGNNADSLTGYTQNFDLQEGATSAIKTINGLALASVKTVNGLAIASVKTVNGLA